MTKCCDIFDVFDEKNNLIKEYQHWTLLVRNSDRTLGNCVAITKRHMLRFSDITPEEMQDFANLVKDVEHALKSAFQYDKINYLMLMMRDPHTHFHILPRYSSPRKFTGMDWVDSDWPKPPAIGQQSKPDVSQEIRNQIREEIKKHLPK